VSSKRLWSGDRRKALKCVWYAVRDWIYGAQLAQSGRIVDLRQANVFWHQVLDCDATALDEVYQRVDALYEQQKALFFAMAEPPASLLSKWLNPAGLRRWLGLATLPIAQGDTYYFVYNDGCDSSPLQHPLVQQLLLSVVDVRGRVVLQVLQPYGTDHDKEIFPSGIGINAGSTLWLSAASACYVSLLWLEDTLWAVAFIYHPELKQTSAPLVCGVAAAEAVTITALQQWFHWPLALPPRGTSATFALTGGPVWWPAEGEPFAQCFVGSTPRLLAACRSHAGRCSLSELQALAASLSWQLCQHVAQDSSSRLGAVQARTHELDPSQFQGILVQPDGGGPGVLVLAPHIRRIWEATRSDQRRATESAEESRGAERVPSRRECSWENAAAECVLRCRGQPPHALFAVFPQLALVWDRIAVGYKSLTGDLVELVCQLEWNDGKKRDKKRLVDQLEVTCCVLMCAHAIVEHRGFK
jgi:hypothetical protein